MLEAELARELADWEDQGLRRRERPRGSGVDFVTNDYLGLAGASPLVEAARAATLQFGAGGRSSRLLAGGCPLEREAERAAAAWVGAEDALLFPSGYQANLGLVPALVGPGDLVLSDALNHASLVDGARLSRARVEVHGHLDLDHLDSLLALPARRKLVLVEGVYSMDGDAPDLAAWAEACARHGASLVVDEAHALGLLGPTGGGAWAAAEADAGALAARVLTGGKALGVMGAFVAGSRLLREQLLQRARSFAFTTAPMPALAGALVAAIAAARRADAERERALDLARRLAAGLGLPRPHAAIVPIPVGSGERALLVSDLLGRKGMDVRAIRRPTVPEGAERLRVVCHGHNSTEEVDRLIDALREVDLPGGAVLQSQAEQGSPLVVLGTDTDVGKTVVSALLLRAARRRGPARYWKPVQTGSDSDTETVRRLAGGELLPPSYALPLPASPHEAARDAGVSIDVSRMDEDLAIHRRARGVLIIELAGGVHVPLTDHTLQTDWLAGHRLPSVLVARAGLGTLNHTLLTLEALERRRLTPRALVLVGRPHESNRRTLAERSGLPVFELPALDPLDGDALDRWIDERDISAILPVIRTCSGVARERMRT